jgi:hypothetical protein
LYNAVRAVPTWHLPVGLAAIRTRTGVDAFMSVTSAFRFSSRLERLAPRQMKVLVPLVPIFCMVLLQTAGFTFFVPYLMCFALNPGFRRC